MKAVKAAAAVVILAVLVTALTQSFFGLPPLGKFLNPTSGFWSNAESRRGNTQQQIKLKDAKDSITVEYDAAMVPHIFAKNDHDLYLAQGYVTAKDRLWQMDLQVRKAAGRLSEVYGIKTLQQDIYFRKLRLTAAAASSLELMNRDCAVKEMLQAYSDGVNAYIDGLEDSELPVEYKLFNYKPEKWEPINSVMMIKLMAETLTGGSNDFEMTEALQQLGEASTASLFPAYPSREDPVIPGGTPWNFSPVTAKMPVAAKMSDLAGFPSHPEKSEGIGSNNWAVGSKKSYTGYPVLENDPHLKLTLPSIWYQVQLSAPGQNVCGVSMPGTPAVVIGFNSNIAWGVTNAYADVMDWYKIDFKDESLSEYAYDNKWLPVRKKVEWIKVKDGGMVPDTVLITHYGPVFENQSVRRQDRNRYALKWVAAEATQELSCFYYLNRAGNFDEFSSALSYYTAPAQNFVYADNQKHIAMVAAGRYPLKYKEQGKFVMDGSNPANEWQGWVPAAHNPRVVDPERGFVSSANQSITDTTYPYYINWQFSPSERARRINQRLAGMEHATVDSLINLQNDTYSVAAEDILPLMLSKTSVAHLSGEQLKVQQLLEKWDRRFDRNSIGAAVFNAWWGALYNSIWQDEFSFQKGNTVRPPRDRTISMLLNEPNAAWFDDKTTPAAETADDLIVNSFKYVVDSLSRKMGPLSSKWEWAAQKATIIEHAGLVKSFGSGFFSTQGTASTVDAISRNTGPSWRMVVELGPTVSAYGIIPGGQSGNPGSYYYDNMLKEWKAGKLQKINYAKAPADGSMKVISSLTINRKS